MQVLLFFVPFVVPVTFTENVHDAAPANVAPERLTDPLPATAEIVPPPQEPVRPFGVATTKPAGSVSVKATPVRLVEALGFVTVKLRVVVPFSAIVEAP